ncbi:MAG: nucleotidyltransferase [Nitrospirae bacterium CG_4_10_14_3_um_filter_44_29]|nr:nucleotidyltransferase family protein [Nitrospirota bacterium]PIP70779.1 MAG: nucleotidyltransferase [Nitrospirae bacterium CG22_combo_CG10-13_8_21_14_all_44_11]PIV41396.1 MAG: nucleotidyltransferase [Nitrospirae bacterium CG02_land_8_20_14_3_00_44_33]PIV66004.1 MAG: nucleotidyltransferase [Nitrospirae bacterium CG01_land_8_20_14_3_00_44_22]PIW90578.1 MAG: nucleotidyltransferase [Nitrospirae bacterium CG_4_8_14_3_um_filter_44_28]PIX87907.1 MAG: nucleotidyltransferase [Nitrospirae bacterium 
MARAKNKKILTGEEILSLLRGRRDILRKYRVKKIGLFGSYAREEQKKRSDIDLIVEFDRTVFDINLTGYFDNFMGLSSYLENLFGEKVDILTPVSIETIRVKEVADKIKQSAIYV